MNEWRSQAARRQGRDVVKAHGEAIFGLLYQ